jgi:citrate lyase subunit beta/citryl-CoA lyase
MTGTRDPYLRPRRSALYMPADNVRALEKAKTIPADALIFDLEDAVAPDAKLAARANAVAAAGSRAYGRRQLTIRCNALSTPWGIDDVTAAATSGAGAVVIPKVDSARYLDEISGLLDSAGAPSALMIWAMIESPTAILDIREIAGHRRVEVLLMGNNDLARELRTGVLPERTPLIPALAMALLGAREAGKVILDGVYNDVADADGFLAEARHGKAMGFDGKTLVHPSQVGPTNTVWSPSSDEIELSERVIAAFAEAGREGRGVATVDGRMIEQLHVDNARRILGVAEAIAELG